MAKEKRESKKENKNKFGDKILEYALINAINHNGKAQADAILPKLFQDGLKKENIREIMPAIQNTVTKVNSMSITEQESELRKIAPSFFEKKHEKKHEEKHELPDLPNVKGKVITAFPPEPSGYPHIGHAKGALINYEYAKKYNGKFILRFEDTNPELAKKEYYDAQIEGYKWLGITWDELIYVSDTIPQMYKKAEELIKKNHLYACTCSSEIIKKNRIEGRECECRKRKPAENLKLFRDMLNGKFAKGDIVIRLMGNMKDDNTAMRDPAMFRIIKAKHPRLGTKIIVWPNYDFAAAYSDGIEGITHRVRSKEFELRAELQRILQKLMGFKQTLIIEQARFNLSGAEASKRKIREGIDNKIFIGWDDPRLATLVALKRRGFQPEAIKSFLLNMGISKHESIIEWSLLEAENRKFIDAKANRYFFIENPVKIDVKNCPKIIAKIPLHPDHAERGNRILTAERYFFIKKEEYEEIKKSKDTIFRFMNLLNFKKIKKGKDYIFEFHSKEMQPLLKAKMIHWLPVEEKNIEVEILMPDNTSIRGLAEYSVRELDVDSIVQFERFGFCRLDKKTKDKLYFWFTHK